MSFPDSSTSLEGPAPTALVRSLVAVLGVVAMVASMLGFASAAKPPSPPGAVSGLVFWDLHGNGIRDSTTHLFERIDVMLDRETPDGLREVARTRTGRDGTYRVDGLEPARYRVRFDIPGGYKFATPHQGVDPAIDSDVTVPLDGATDLLVVADGERTAIDAGIIVDRDSGTALPRRHLGSVGGTVFHDADGDGARGDAEHAEPFVPVRLYRLDTDGPDLIDTGQTNRRGAYDFSGLLPGQYQVGFTAPDGFGFGPTSGVDDAGFSPVLVVAPGGSASFHAGLSEDVVAPATLDGVAFADADGDGIQNGDEGGIAGLDVVATIDGQEISTSTDASGQFVVQHALPPGAESEWILRITDPGSTYVTGAGSGFDESGTQAFPASDASTTSVTAAMVEPVTLTGEGFHDLRAFGIQSSLGDEPLAGVTVKAVHDDENLGPVDTVTGADGLWTLSVRPGGVTITAVKDGYLHSPVDQVEDLLDSDIPAAGLHVSVPAGGTRFDVGMWTHATVDGVLWNDLDEDGRREDGEPLRGDGEAVELIDDIDDTVVRSTNTVAGAYSFTSVAPGNYRVRFPLGSPTLANQGDDGTDSDALAVGNPATALETAPFNLVSAEAGRYDAGYVDPTEPPPPTGSGTVRVTFLYDINDNRLVDGEDWIYQQGALQDPATGTTLFSNNADGTVTMEVAAGDVPLRAWSITSGSVVHGGPWSNGAATIPVVADEVTQVTALVIASARLSVHAWEDRLADGYRGTADPALPGVTIAGSGEASFSGTTISTGAAQFQRTDGTLVTTYEVPPGEYLITSHRDGFFHSPAPTNPSLANPNHVPAGGVTVTLTAGSTTPLNALLYQDVVVRGDVWIDEDGDRLQDVDEPRRNGVLVELLDENGVPTGHSQLTDHEFPDLPEGEQGRAGTYTFTVTPGRYQVRFEAGPFIAQSFANQQLNSDVVDHDAGTTDVFAAESGGLTIDRDAGYRPSSVTSGRLVDIDGAPVRADVRLSSSCQDTVTTTDADGRWSIVTAICFPGVLATLAIQHPELVTAADTGFNQDDQRTIHPTETDLDLGSTTMVFKVEVVFRSFHDRDADGVLFGDDLELRLDGVTFAVTHLDENKSYPTVDTDATGEASMLMVPGTIRVSASKTEFHNDELEADNDVGPTPTEIVLSSAGTTLVDAGLYRMSRLPVKLFMDVNENRIWDPDDPEENRAPQVRITIYRDSVVHAGPFTNDGATDMEFVLKPGGPHAYTLQFEILSGASGFTANSGSGSGGEDQFPEGGSQVHVATGTASNQFTLPSGGAGQTIHAGFLPPIPGEDKAVSAKADLTVDDVTYTCQWTATATGNSDGTHTLALEQTAPGATGCGPTGGTVSDPTVMLCQLSAGARSCAESVWFESGNGGEPESNATTVDGDLPTDYWLELYLYLAFSEEHTLGSGTCEALVGSQRQCSVQDESNDFFGLFESDGAP